VRQVRDQLTDLKEWWNELNDLYSTVTQAAVMRIEDSITALSELKERGYNVGSLNWKAPQDFRSFTYVQSGFEFDGGLCIVAKTAPAASVASNRHVSRPYLCGGA
jgi:putative transposase